MKQDIANSFIGDKNESQEKLKDLMDLFKSIPPLEERKAFIFLPSGNGFDIYQFKEKTLKTLVSIAHNMEKHNL
jgi:hypothetical protein